MRLSKQCQPLQVVAVVGLLLAPGFPSAMASTVRMASANFTGTDSGNLLSFVDGDDLTHTMGDFIVFASEATDLTTVADTNASCDVFRRDTHAGTTELVSINAVGTAAGNDGSCTFRVSVDGRWVLFESHASDLVAGDSNGVEDVFLRDMQNGVTTLVSVAAGGGSGNGWSELTDFTPDGLYAVFLSEATDLVAETDTNGARDVFVRDLVGGTTTLVSVATTGTSAGGALSNSGVITPDGRYVYFYSEAQDLVAVDTNGLPDAFRRDLQTQTTQLVSLNEAGTDSAAGSSYNQAISDDGSIVIFPSDATDLVSTPDTNATFDLFVRDMVAGTTSLVSINSAGTAAGNGSTCCDAAITPDGRFILFSSQASDLAPPDADSGNDGFVHDRLLGTNTLVTINSDGTTSGNGSLGTATLSDNGRLVAFASSSDNLVADDGNSDWDVFVRDMDDDATTLISRNASGESATGGSYAALLSSDDRRVVFSSYAPDLVDVDTNGDSDVFWAVVPGVIFSDGFESGDTSAWSSTVP